MLLTVIVWRVRKPAALEIAVTAEFPDSKRATEEEGAAELIFELDSSTVLSVGLLDIEVAVGAKPTEVALKADADAKELEAEPALTGAELAGAELAGAELAGAALAGAALAGAALAGTELAGAELAGAELAGAALAGTELAGAELAGAELAGAELAGAELT